MWWHVPVHKHPKCVGWILGSNIQIWQVQQLLKNLSISSVYIYAVDVYDNLYQCSLHGSTVLFVSCTYFRLDNSEWVEYWNYVLIMLCVWLHYKRTVIVYRDSAHEHCTVCIILGITRHVLNEYSYGFDGDIVLPCINRDCTGRETPGTR